MNDTDILSDAKSVVLKGTAPRFSRDEYEAEAERLVGRDARAYAKSLRDDPEGDVAVLVYASRAADIGDYVKGYPERAAERAEAYRKSLAQHEETARNRAYAVLVEGAQRANPGVPVAKAVDSFLRTPDGAAAYARYRTAF